MKVIITLAMVILIMASLPATARETDIVAWWCKGRAEVELENHTRVDCLTEDYAIEADWAKKWYEAVGQSLYYAAETGKEPGILLIQKNPWDELYLKRLYKTIQIHDLHIHVWWLPFVGPAQNTHPIFCKKSKI